MTFELFGFDYIREENLYGIWFLSFRLEHGHRSLFEIYNEMGYIHVCIFWRKFR